MPKSEIVSIRLPEGTRAQLKLLACKKSLQENREIRWTSLVRVAIQQMLTAKPI